MTALLLNFVFSFLISASTLSAILLPTSRRTAISALTTKTAQPLGGAVSASRAVTLEMALPASVLMAGTWALTLV